MPLCSPRAEQLTDTDLAAGRRDAREMAEVDLNDIIEQTAQEPKSTTVDGTSTSTHSLRDLVEAAKFQKKQNARANGKLPIQMFRSRPGGSA